MDKNKIVEIKNLVRDAHLKSAIKELMELLSGSNLEREAILLKQRFNHLDKDTAWLEYKSVQEERTRIGMSVLQLLASLDDFDFNIDNLTKNETLLAVLKSKLLPFYEPIYTWHQQEAITDFHQNFGMELVSIHNNCELSTVRAYYTAKFLYQQLGKQKGNLQLSYYYRSGGVAYNPNWAANRKVNVAIQFNAIH